MDIGIPKEIKIQETRIALIPAAAAEIIKHGHQVFLEQGAGLLSGYADSDYSNVGVKICPSAEALYNSAEMILKVKEPITSDLELLKSHHLLFSYLHLAAAPKLMQSLCDIGLTAIAFETVETSTHHLPLLAPMSDIAGRVSIHTGTTLLHHHNGGRGLLLGGLPGSERGKVVILGAGVAGGNAASVAAALGSEVTVFDRNRDNLQAMRALGNNVTGLHALSESIHEAVIEADLLIGAVLVKGEKAPHLVSAETVKAMKPGSVIIDISVDQGGCIETTRPTNWDEPTFIYEQVVHFGVTNMPAVVPVSASQVLSAALVPYLISMAHDDWRNQPDLAAGVNVRAGEVVHPALK